MKHITDWVHDGLRPHLRPGDWAVDATLGHGHDAALLANCVGPGGKVWGFDIQAEAIDSASRLLADVVGFSAVLADHARMAEHLPPAARGRLRAVVFNLGYLPGADHQVTTRSESTLAALEGVVDWLAPGGVLSCTCYPGHPGGEAEAQAVSAWFATRSGSQGQLTRIECLETKSPAPFTLWFENRATNRRVEPALRKRERQSHPR